MSRPVDVVATPVDERPKTLGGHRAPRATPFAPPPLLSRHLRRGITQAVETYSWKRGQHFAAYLLDRTLCLEAYLFVFSNPITLFGL